MVGAAGLAREPAILLRQTSQLDDAPNEGTKALSTSIGDLRSQDEGRMSPPQALATRRIVRWGTSTSTPHPSLNLLM